MIYQHVSFRNFLFTSFLSFFITALPSCKDSSPSESCGCEGKTIKSVKNLDAVYVGNGYFHIKGTDESKPEILYTFQSCDIMSGSLEVSLEQMVPNYILSGDIKKSCFSGETLVAITPNISITELKKK